MISEVDILTAKIAGTDTDIRNWQLGQIRRLIPRLKRESAFYAKHLTGIDSTEITSMQELSRIPFTYPEDIADPDMFLCVPMRDIARVTASYSSGTTGPAKRMYFTAGDLGRTMDFFSIGMTPLVMPGGHAAIMISSATSDSVGDLLKRALERNGVRAEILAGGDDASADAIARVDCVVGLPSEMIRLCRLHPDLRPGTALLTADYVPESIARGIRDTWGCGIFTHYGMTETGFGCAVQCRAGEAHHIRHGEMFLEIVDPATGNMLPPSEEGEIVVTTFAADAMPLLRYRTGDIASIIESRCPCGGEFPRLRHVKGRGDNFLWRDGTGRTMLWQLDELVYSFDSVLAYRARVLQKERDDILSLALDAKPSLDREFFESAVRRGISRHRETVFSYENIDPRIGSKKLRAEREPVR